MDTEFEVKFYPIVKSEYRKKLKTIGAKLVVPERLMRRNLVTRWTYPQLKCDYIRVRDEGNLIRLSAKTHASEGGDISDQKEIDIVVNDYDKAIRIIETMGFKFERYQESLRETWELDEAEITIDIRPGLEPYTEIEAKSEDEVKNIAVKLGFEWNDRIITSAVEIYMKVYNLSEKEVLKKLEKISFEENPFRGLKS